MNEKINIKNGALIILTFISVISFTLSAHAQGQILDCSQPGFMGKARQILLQKIGGEANMPSNIDLDNQIRSLPSCTVTDQDLQALADDLRTTRERQDNRQVEKESIMWQQQAFLWLALIVGVVLAAFLALWRKKYGTALLVGGVVFFILTNISFFITMGRLSRIGEDGPPFILPMFALVVLPTIAVLSAVGYIIDVIRARRRSPRSK